MHCPLLRVQDALSSPRPGIGVFDNPPLFLHAHATTGGELLSAFAIADAAASRVISLPRQMHARSLQDCLLIPVNDAMPHLGLDTTQWQCFTFRGSCWIGTWASARMVEDLFRRARHFAGVQGHTLETTVVQRSRITLRAVYSKRGRFALCA